MQNIRANVDVTALTQALGVSLAAPASAGLRRAMTLTPMVLICAHGAAHEAAVAAQQVFSGVAQWPMWARRPDGLRALGAGLWRLAQLVVVAPSASGAPLTQALELASSYHCPSVALDAHAPAHRQPPVTWTLPVPPCPEACDAFVWHYTAWVALALQAAKLRHGNVAPQALDPADHITQLYAQCEAEGPLAHELQAMAQWCRTASVVVAEAHDEALAAALHAWLLVPKKHWPQVFVAAGGLASSMGLDGTAAVLTVVQHASGLKLTLRRPWGTADAQILAEVRLPSRTATPAMLAPLEAYLTLSALLDVPR